MVLGPKTINRKSPSLQIDYLIHIQEIKPWPPSQSLRSLRSVLIHWENGERNSGFTKPVVPSLEPGFNDGRIEFNESFKLTVAFVRDFSVKAGNGDAFQKNCLELNLYEPRRDNLKGQLIGTVIIDLTDYGVVKEPVSISAPLNCKRNFRNMAQSFLYVKIQHLDKGRTSSSSKGTISKKASLMKSGIHSPSSSMNGEYADEAEIASYTDDDVSSHSSVTVSSSPLGSNHGLPHENRQNGLNMIMHHVESGDKKQTIALEDGSKRLNVIETSTGCKSTRGYSSRSSSVDLSSELGDTNNDLASLLVSSRSSAVVVPEADADIACSVDSFLPNDELDEASDGPMKKIEDKGLSLKNHEEVISRTGMHIDASFKNMGPTKHVWQVKTLKNDERKLAKIYPTDARNGHSNSKLQQLKQRMQILEGELREAAVLEVAIYSVAAEHGGSTTKVHAPARRLYRFYHHACREFSRPQRVSAARSAVSGLVLASKACGNDVPRLTYWLSNAILLRAMLSQKVPKGSTKALLPSNGQEFPQRKMGTKCTGVTEDVEGICTFLSELEKVEAQIFSRIVESVWWQNLTPHMQSSAAKTLDKHASSVLSKNNKKVINADHEQVNIALELWKKAFKDACEGLCPVRAGGHECGCLPMLRRLIMEECVARLDVAMFNAILRESGDEMPSDPVSDPISDPKVLPIPSGKSSFRAGAQLKNVIGNWSRWLTNLFDMDDDLSEDQYMVDAKSDASFKPFRLLNALSDLMMLPKDMLLDRSIRKQVCPTFGPSLIRRILCNFVPDEFCPDPIPKGLLESLASEELVEIGEGSFTTYPCNAAAPVYSPPPAGVGDTVNQSQLRKSGSLVLKKQYNSDDELDELELPLASLLINGSVSSPVTTNSSQASKESANKKAIRYELLREVWMNSE